MKFIVSQKNSAHGLLLVVTDKDIIGKKFEQGKRQLDLSKDFYKGEPASAEEIEKLLKTARHIHLTGEKSVNLAKKLDLIDEERVLIVQHIPHAEVFREI